MTGSPPHADVPRVVYWETTKACPLACIHCRAVARLQPGPNELSHEEGVRLIEQVAAMKPQPILVLTGGDPLMRPDLVKLVQAATERGLRTAVAPAPSGRLTTSALRGLRDAGAWGIAISLDDAGPAGHDAFRRRAGSFKAGCRALRAATDLGFFVQVNTVVHGGNLHRLPDIFLMVHGLGADSWEVIPLIPVGRAVGLRSLDRDEMESVYHFLDEVSGYGVRVRTGEAPAFRRVVLQRREEGNRNPRAGVWAERVYSRLGTAGIPGSILGDTRSGAGVLFVAADGAIYPSGFLPQNAGNARVTPLLDAYRNRSLFRALREPSSFRGPCGRCPYTGVCGGSRARAFAAGDALGSDPSCAYAPSLTQ